MIDRRRVQRYSVAAERHARDLRKQMTMGEALLWLRLKGQAIQTRTTSPQLRTTTACRIALRRRRYDGHGNMVALLSRTTGNSYTVSNRRSFDCWGNVRLGSATGDPTGRHCANLGHKQDDESGLIYMRARYYEPASGRFVSEDMAHQYNNWYVYSADDPISFADGSGDALDFSPPSWGPGASNALWFIGLANNLVGLINSAIAYAKIVQSMRLAEDGNDVENAWGAFMKRFRKSVAGMIDDSGYLSNGLTWAQRSLSTLNGIGKNTSPWGCAQTIISGAILGAQFAILGLAYTMRLEWYIMDIDR